MSCASRSRGRVLSLEVQRALTFYRGSQDSSRRGGSPPPDLRVINLGQGDPSYITPPHIRERAKQAIDEGHTHYERNQLLKEAIAAKLQRENAITVDPMRGIVVTPGAHAALYQTMKALLVPGDEVIMGDPGSYYFSNTVVNGAVPVQIPLRAERGFRLDPADVERAITGRTRVLCLTSPDAPAGAVHTRDDLLQLAALARRYDLVVVSDELYEYINFGQVPHTSIASLPGMASRTLTVNGVSKGWAMTGWRLGYVAGPEDLIEPVAAIHHLNLISVNSIAQWAALEALTGPQDFIARSVKEYRERMELLLKHLNGVPGVSVRMPDGAYYCWTDVSERVADVAAFSTFFWEHYAVRALPGTDFGPQGEGYLRLSCAPPAPDIEEGVERLARALDHFERLT